VNSPSEYRSLVFAQYGRFAPRVLHLYPLSRFYSPYVAFRTVAADSDTVCPAIVTDQDLARWMPVYGYLINDGDPPPNNATLPSGSAHVAAWTLTPATGNFDANAQVLQTQELQDATAFARRGDPTARFTPVWPEFNSSQEEMTLSPGADSIAMPIAEIQREHNCAFWDKISPKP
jgi:para-nitrobenzyl esterase